MKLTENQERLVDYCQDRIADAITHAEQGPERHRMFWCYEIRRNAACIGWQYREGRYWRTIDRCRKMGIDEATHPYIVGCRRLNDVHSIFPFS